jgi:hypothetical protein
LCGEGTEGGLCGEGTEGETGEKSDLYWLADGVKKVGLGGARGTNGERKNCGRK